MKYLSGQQLRPHNSLRLAAIADAGVAVNNDTELGAALAWARKRNLPVIPLGEGSNVVLAGDVKGLVLLQQSRGIERIGQTGDRVTLRVGAGENWHTLVEWCTRQGYYGLENLALIPGTAGAAPIQNIGAYGVELQSVLKRVHARRTSDGGAIELDGPACEFDYRDSVFKHGLRDQCVITAIDLQLDLQPRVNISYPAIAEYLARQEILEPTPAQVFDAVVSIRRSKLPDPALEPNAGSFFKNPVLSAALAGELAARYPSLPVYPQAGDRVKIAAGWMIEQCGFKGFRKGDLGVHSEHALVLVNYGDATGGELLALAADIAGAVYDKFGVQLEVEPRVYGAGT